MPILWKHLLSHYLKVLLLCVAAFIAILLTTRLDEIAHFATMGSEAFYVLLFAIYQIPYILPIAIPAASLISSIILIQRLSQTHELTALRSVGMSLGSILAPILFAAAFLALANFYIVSEMSTHSHLTTCMLKKDQRFVNPLLLLHNKHLLKLKGIFFHTLGASKLGESASDVILAMPGKHGNSINFMFASNLRSSPEHFLGHDVTLITALESVQKDKLDQLILENIEDTSTTIQDFTEMLQKKVWTLNNDHLRMPLLLARLAEEKQQAAGSDSAAQKLARRNTARIYSEIIRRVSIALAVFTFTLMGASFGVSISRNHSNKGLYVVIGLAAFYLICFFAAKGWDNQPGLASLLYLFPHALIIFLSLWTLRRAARGIE